MKYMWEGRFKFRPDKDMIDFTKSIDIDKKLAIYDVKGSIAYTKILCKAGIIEKKEEKKIIDGLKEIEKEIKENKFRIFPTDEDIHTAIERRLIELIGKIGEKLHTGRSRNEQIVLDEKLYLKDEIKNIVKKINSLQNAFVQKAEEFFGFIMPGYTHLKQSQPVLISHYFLAFVEMFERDKGRFISSYKRMDFLPLGVGACVGTGISIDRKYLAKLLGFSKISKNSIDTVSDRDFILEFATDCIIFLIHISRFCEDIIIWNTDEFQFVELPDKFCTGSSLMPHKKNPDIFELIRGKSSSSIGALFGLMCLLKGLPLSYNRDLQEDKKHLFEIIETVENSIKILLKITPEIKFNTDRIEKMISEFTLATDIAEYLVKKKIPFRKAHSITGEIVRYCIENKKKITSLTLEEFKKFSCEFEDDIFEFLDFKNSINSKTSIGGTSCLNVKKELERWKRNLKNFSIHTFISKMENSI